MELELGLGRSVAKKVWVGVGAGDEKSCEKLKIAGDGKVWVGVGAGEGWGWN